MIVNIGKFQTMIINRFGKMQNKHEMHIDNKVITSEHSVQLLSIKIDNQLKFDNHVSTVCKKVSSESSQLNAICRLTLVFLKKDFNTKKSSSIAI